MLSNAPLGTDLCVCIIPSSFHVYHRWPEDANYLKNTNKQEAERNEIEGTFRTSVFNSLLLQGGITQASLVSTQVKSNSKINWQCKNKILELVNANMF